MFIINSNPKPYIDRRFTQVRHTDESPSGQFQRSHSQRAIPARHTGEPRPRAAIQTAPAQKRGGKGLEPEWIYWAAMPAWSKMTVYYCTGTDDIKLSRCYRIERLQRGKTTCLMAVQMWDDYKLPCNAYAIPWKILTTPMKRARVCNDAKWHEKIL